MGTATQTAESVSGRYRIGDVIGRGGMATVYAARDEVLGRDVAIKLFPPGLADEDEIRRQRTEVKMLATLSHHNLVTLLDAGVDLSDAGLPRIYLVMELVRGPDLRERLGAGPLTPLEVAQLGYDLAEALEYMHSTGVVHHDVKPANILLDEEPGSARRVRAKLTDFGIADVEGRVPDETEMTTGTAAYLSPEQVRREPVTGASDVYSLGLVLLECFTGRVAFPGGLVESALRRLTDDPAIPNEVPAAWRDLLAAMTARAAGDRPGIEELVLTFRQLAIAESGVPQHAVLPPGASATEAARLAAVRRYGMLDAMPEPSFDRITALAARVLDVPVAILTVIDHDRTWFRSHGDELNELDPDLVASAVLRDARWIVEDAWTDQDAAARNPLIAAGFRFYAGVPLRTPDGHSIGTLCVLDAAPRAITEDEVATLEDLGAMAMNELDLRAAGAQLTLPAL